MIPITATNSIKADAIAAPNDMYRVIISVVSKADERKRKISEIMSK
jgi:hypothetical protein